MRMKTTLYQCPICKIVFTSRMTNPHCPENDEHDEWKDIIKIGEIEIEG